VAKTISIHCGKFQAFYVAEDKHQKNSLKRHPGLLKSFDEKVKIVDSYVATRLNGYTGGCGKMAGFNKEWKELGLSKKIAEYVRNVIIKRCWIIITFNDANDWKMY